MITVTDDMLASLLYCEPADGELYWRQRDRSWFQDNRSCNTWNTKFAGKKALDVLNLHGYRTGCIYGRRLQKHRVIWFLTHGVWPVEIDHINGNRSDNRLCNLRDVTPSQNQKNKQINCNNTSGQMGVGFHKGSNRWRAYLTTDRAQITLGYFREIEDAIAARKAAEAEHGFHSNHGRAAL